MKTILKFLLLLLLLPLLRMEAQEYERTWGTYLGPAGNTGSQNIYHSNGSFDTNGNFYNFNQIVTNNNFTASYYNQFATSGSGYDTSKFSNASFSGIGNSGNILFYNYDDMNDFSNPNFSYDSAGNRFVLQYNSAGILATGTAGTWNPTAFGNENKMLISKYNTSSVLQWQTFVPENSLIFKMIHDDVGNTYITSSTLLSNGFTTSGVFVENFEVLYDNDGKIKPNNYLVKLDANGTLVWATYFPTTIEDLKYCDGNIYVLGSWDINPNASIMASPNAFQSQKAQCSITKINANTGNRIWGTYYGTPTTSTLQIFHSMEVNNSGIYLIGDITDYLGTHNSYFGTPGSHQPTQVGNSDVYLTKFGHDGARIWSTYFGSPGEEYSSFSASPLALVGDDVIITLFQFSINGATNLATPGSYMDTMPTSSYFNGSTNLLFAKFNSNGVLSWSSYYGGASINNAQTPTMGVKAKNSNTFYLYGATLANTGITTPGAAQITKLPDERTGFVARFDKKGEMNTSETVASQDLVLHNNPNKGNFYLSGSLLQKQNSRLKIYDASGRLVHQQSLSKNAKQYITLEHLLTKGNYMVEVSSSTKTSLKTFKMIVE